MYVCLYYKTYIYIAYTLVSQTHETRRLILRLLMRQRAGILVYIGRKWGAEGEQGGSTRESSHTK